MPLFKVRSVSRGGKMTVVAENFEQLLLVTQTKLQLGGSVSSYKVFDDSDGSLIDDDDCLQALVSFANSKGEHLSLAILEQGEEWRAWSPLNVVRPNSGSDTSDLSSERGPVEDFSVSPPLPMADVAPTVLPALPYQEVTKKLRDALKSPSHIRNQALTRARRSVMKTLTEKLKNKTLMPGTLPKVCSKIHSSCPEAFHILLKEGNRASSLPQFSRSLYNALGYAKEVEGIRRRQRRRTRHSESEDVDDPEELPHFRVDTNGCLEGMWAPSVSEDQLDQLEEQRARLSDLASQSDDALTHTLMKSTYALQRHYINGARTVPQWRNLVESWPIMNQRSFYLCHANMLLGKEVLTVWNSEFSSSHVIFQFFAEYAEKNSSVKAEKMKSCLRAADEAVESLDSSVPRRLALLPLLALYLGDCDKDFFLVVRDPLATTEEIVSKASSVSKCPLLVVNGLSIFDNAAQAYVVVRGELVVEANNILDGALLVVLSYFVFNISYPKRLARSLEFLQRFFLHVNTPRMNARVSSLASSLADFEAHISRFSSS